MSFQQQATLLSLVSVVALSGCHDDRHIAWERDRQVIGPVAIKSRVAYIDSARDSVVVIDTAEGRPRTHATRIGRRAVYAAPTPDREHLAVLTAGEEAVYEGQVDEEPKLWIVDVANADAEALAYEVGSPFDRLAVSADGSVAVAYFSSGGFDASLGVFRNPNELAIIDLTGPPSEDNPHLRTVRSFGSAPDGVVLSPPMAIPGAADPTPRILAFVLAKNTLTLLDATYPERREVSIRLDAAGNDVRPREVVFAPNSGMAYLRSDNAADVLAVMLSYEEPGDELQDNDYQPTLAELGAGSGPADVAVYDDVIGRRFVVAAMPGTRKVAVIDGDTAEFVTVPTPDPIDRVMLFPSDPELPPRIALLASISSSVPRVHILSLEGITEQLTPIDLRTVNLSENVLDVVEVPGSEAAMIVHDHDRTVLGLLDVRLGSVSPLEGIGRLESYDFDDQGQTLFGVSTDVERVGMLDLDSLHPHDMRLDDVPRQVFSLASGAVFVDHGDPLGRATILPHAHATRDESVVLSGFMLADYLDAKY